jgi:glycerophosphoryl diester phosphodiesterase
MSMLRAHAFTLALVLSSSACVVDRCTPPILFGHRGTPLFAPENTLPAFEWAFEKGADGIELDVKQTADGVLVAMHDATTWRTTNDASSRRIDAVTLDELRALDAGAWFGSRFVGTRVPTLDEVAAALPDDRALLIDHLSSDRIDLILTLLEDDALRARTFVSSFDLDALAAFSERAPDVPTVAFVDDMSQLERARGIKARALRIPKDVESDLSLQNVVLAAGMLPAVSGRYTQWNGGIGLVNDMGRTTERRRERAPEGCIVE